MAIVEIDFKISTPLLDPLQIQINTLSLLSSLEPRSVQGIAGASLS